MAVCVNVCDYIIHYRECQWFFWKKFFCFFKKVLCFLEKMWYTKPYHFICACSSVDRAPASGAGCVGSIPIRRTIVNPDEHYVRRGFLFPWSHFCYCENIRIFNDVFLLIQGLQRFLIQLFFLLKYIVYAISISKNRYKKRHSNEWRFLIL